MREGGRRETESKQRQNFHQSCWVLRWYWGLTNTLSDLCRRNSLWFLWTVLWGYLGVLEAGQSLPNLKRNAEDHKGGLRSSASMRGKRDNRGHHC